MLTSLLLMCSFVLGASYLTGSLIILLYKVDTTIYITKRLYMVFAWYDWWGGAYFNEKKNHLYLMLPFIGVRILTNVYDPQCSSCAERTPRNECLKSRRACGHHCNCSWHHDQCCWCGTVFGANGRTDPDWDTAMTNDKD